MPETQTAKDITDIVRYAELVSIRKTDMGDGQYVVTECDQYKGVRITRLTIMGDIIEEDCVKN